MRLGRGGWTELPGPADSGQDVGLFPTSPLPTVCPLFSSTPRLASQTTGWPAVSSRQSSQWRHPRAPMAQPAMATPKIPRTPRCSTSLSRRQSRRPPRSRPTRSAVCAPRRYVCSLPPFSPSCLLNARDNHLHDTPLTTPRSTRPSRTPLCPLMRPDPSISPTLPSSPSSAVSPSTSLGRSAVGSRRPSSLPSSLLPPSSRSSGSSPRSSRRG